MYKPRGFTGQLILPHSRKLILMANSQAFTRCKLKLEIVCPGSTTGRPTSYPPFHRTNSSFNKWLHNIQLDLITAEIPGQLWPYAALLYLPSTVRELMVYEQCKSRITNFDGFGVDWTWAEFASCFKSLPKEEIGYAERIDHVISLTREVLNSVTSGRQVGQASISTLALQKLCSDLRHIWENEEWASPTEIASKLCLEWLSVWIKIVEENILRLPSAPPKLWAYIGMMFLPDDSDIQARMKKLQTGEDGFETYGLDWSWADFENHLRSVLVQQGKDNSLINTATKVGITAAAVLGGAALGPAIIVEGLQLVGFQTAGVAAGSAASIAQSIIWRGATGGIFSVCQSVGATGVVGAAGTATTAAASGAATAAGFFGFGRRADAEENRSSWDGRD